jgi:hypothetical protein
LHENNTKVDNWKTEVNWIEVAQDMAQCLECAMTKNFGFHNREFLEQVDEYLSTMRKIQHSIGWLVGWLLAAADHSVA